MEFFKSVLGSSQGSSGSGKHADQQSGAETVERLVERLHSSTLLEDRRDACRALRSLSRKYRVEVGAQGMDAVLHILSIDRMDSEIVTYCVEILLNVTSPTLIDDEDETMKDVGNQFTEILVKKSDNVTVLVSLLDEYDFRIRLPLIRLLTNLLTNRPKEVQDTLLISPMGTSKLMDLLSDTREVIRNDAILLLSALTKNNSNIQKIMAFENGFDKILTIIHEEGYSDGSPVVEDSLNLFLSLLRNNTSNQTIFREGNYAKRILPFFQILNDQNMPQMPDGDLGWPTQKVSNFYHMLQVVRTLVSPLNPTQVTLNSQKVMKTSGVVECLCKLLMSSGIPVETLTEVIITVGELMRGSIENREYFNSLVAPTDPPRPALVLLMMSLINDSQLLSLRCAVDYCVNCFLFKNEAGQSEIVKSLLPGAQTKAGVVTAGQLICSGLFNKDIATNWFTSISLGHALLNNVPQKGLLLKVKLATRNEKPPITLMHHLLATLNTNPKVQVKLSLLQLLAIWLEQCGEAVAHFLSDQLAIQYLISQITTADMIDKEALVNGLCAFVMGLCLHFNSNSVEAFNKENMHQLMTNRIGVEQITNGLSQITKSDYYLQALKHPQVNARHANDLVFDHSFALLFKKYEPLILMDLSSDHTAANSAPAADVNSANDLSANGYKVTSKENPNTVINQYKSFIRSQDEAIENYKKEITGLQGINAEYKTRLEEMFSEVLQLKSQLTLVIAQKEANGHNQRQIAEDEHLRIVEAKDKRIEELQLQVLKLESHYGNMAPIKNPMQEELIAKLEEENKELVEEVERSKKDQEELLELLAEQDKRIYDYKIQLRQFGVQIPLDEDEELHHDGDYGGSGDTNAGGPVNNIGYDPAPLLVADEKVAYLEQLSQSQEQSQHQQYDETQAPFVPIQLYQNLNHEHQSASTSYQAFHAPTLLAHKEQQRTPEHYDLQAQSQNQNTFQQHQYQHQDVQVSQSNPSAQQNHEQENGLLMASHLFSNTNSNFGGPDNFLLAKMPY